MRLPLIHIGYHKAGSTWLQKVLFVNREAGFISPFEGYRINEHISDPNPLAFDPSACRAYFEPGLEAAYEQGLCPVLSSEGLSGNPHSGGYNSKDLADRLAAAFPEAKILIIIREQGSMILSSYKQYVRVGGTASLARYMQSPYKKGRVEPFDLAYFEYHHLIGYYHQLYGPERVLVLPLEMLKTDSQAYVDTICNFAGMAGAEVDTLKRENVALSAFAISLKRRINPLFVRVDVNPWALLPVRGANKVLTPGLRKLERMVPEKLKAYCDEQLKSEIAAVIGNRYRESNRITARLIQRDLVPYGYDV